MPERLFIPSKVRDALSAHIRAAVANAISAYLSGREDEDTLTGQLGMALRGKGSIDRWTWSIDYFKFRGRGPEATEHKVGADGIIEFHVRDIEASRKKSILFQAKNGWKSDANLLKQSTLLSTWREAAFVMNYMPDGIEAFGLDSVIRSRGKRASAAPAVPLDMFLNDYFLMCKVGDLSLSYDAVRRTLNWRSHTGEYVSLKFPIKHRIRINAQSQNLPLPNANAPKRIDLDEIHDHRLYARPEDILEVAQNVAPRELTRARNALALTFHPDKSTNLTELERRIFERRMQEVNAAYAELLNKSK